jgi:hypothetical protein
LGYKLVENGLKFLQVYGLKTENNLLVNDQIKDKRQRYPQDELKLQILLTLITLPYQGYNAPDGKKWMPLAEHIARN